MALAGGDIGRTPAYPQEPGTFHEDAFRRYTRIEEAPAGLVPAGQLPCFAFDPTVTADCDVSTTPFALGAEERLRLDPAGGFFPMIARLDAVATDGGEVELATTSYQAVYPPATLGVAGLAGRLGGSPTQGLLLARAASGLVCLAFVAAGWLWLLGGPGPGPAGPRLVGGMLALTPMALFLGSTVSGSGVEVAAAGAWVCGLVRATRGPLSASSVLGLAAAGAMVTAARQFGPVWLAATVAFALAARGAAAAGRAASGRARGRCPGGGELRLRRRLERVRLPAHAGPHRGVVARRGGGPVGG